MLRICAEYADSWNSFGTVEEMRERNLILDEHCAAIGRDPREIRRSFYGWAAQMRTRDSLTPGRAPAPSRTSSAATLAVGIDEFVIDQPRPSSSPSSSRLRARSCQGCVEWDVLR